MAIALLSLSVAGVGKVYAYFTSYTQASGSYEIALGDETEIEEEPDGTNKKIVIKNNDNSNQAVYVRAIAFAGSEITLKYTGDGWSVGDGDWYYYSEPLVPGASSKPLLVEVTVPDGYDPDAFKVTVVYESVPAIQNGVDEDGNILYEPADWTRKAGGDE